MRGWGSTGFLTDELRMAQNPDQLEVDLAPTAHRGWQLALTCQSRPATARLVTSAMPGGIGCQSITVGPQMEQARH